MLYCRGRQPLGRGPCRSLGSLGPDRNVIDWFEFERRCAALVGI